MTTQFITDEIGSIAGAMGSNTLPDFDGVLGEWWLGGDAASSRLNAITGVAATLIGAPTYAKGYASMGADNVSGMTLDVGLPTAGSIAALIRSTNGQSTAIACAGTINDYTLRVTDASHASATQNGYGGDQSQVTLPTPANFTLVMGVYLPVTRARIFRIDAAGVVLDDGGYVGNQRPDRDTSPILLGGRPNDQLRGAFDIAALCVTRDLRGSAWLQAIYPLWKAFAQSRGVTVN